MIDHGRGWRLARAVAGPCLFGLAALVWGPAWASDSPNRLERIQARGFLTCGLARNQPGFSQFHAGGKAEGFDADFCRAIAAAIFQDAKRARFSPVATAREFTDRSNIDVAFHRLTVNFSRAVTSGLAFGPITFHDGQAFLVRDGFSAESIAALPRSTICVAEGSKMAANLQQFLAESGLGHTVHPANGFAEAMRAFFRGDCDVLSEDASRLFAVASERMAGALRLLGDRISREPLAPVVRREDRDLLTVVTWTIHAVIHAEEVGVSSQNLSDPALKTSRRRARFLNLPAALVLNLKPDWAKAVIGQVGNYGEIFARHFRRPGAPDLKRGRNRLWRNGGLLYAPPLE